MTLDTMSESYLFQLEKYLNTEPYREYVVNRPYAPLSAHSNRLKKPSSMVFHQFINNQNSPLTLDRIAYKLRMKSALNVDTLRQSHHHEHSHPNSPTNELIRPTPRAATTRTFYRQPTAATRTTNSMKTAKVTEEFNGIEGNAVHVGTLNDIIKHFHQEETRLIHYSSAYSDNLSTYTTSNRLNNEHRTPKPPAFTSERRIKQPQILTEYRFKTPAGLRTAARNQSNHHLNILLPTDQYSLKQQATAKRIQESRAKTLLHTEKQLRICNKLTIIAPFNSNDSHSTLPSSGYICPPVRPFGYLTRKSTESIPNPTPFLPRKKQEMKKPSKISFDSVSQISTDLDDDDSHIVTQVNKLPTTFTDLDDDLENPPNTRVNVNII